MKPRDPIPCTSIRIVLRSDDCFYFRAPDQYERAHASHRPGCLAREARKMDQLL